MTRVSWRRSASTLALCGLSVFLSGCFLARNTTNQPLDPSLLSELRPGESTAGEVTRLLGGPSQVVELGTSRTAYLYEHEVSKYTGLVALLLNLGNVDTRADRVWVFFDQNLVMTHFGATFAAHRTQYGLPWVDLHDPGTIRAKDRRRAQIPPAGRTGG